MKRSRNLFFVIVAMLAFSFVLSACGSQDLDDTKTDTIAYDAVTDSSYEDSIQDQNDVMDSSGEDNSQDEEEVDWGIGSKDIDELGGYEYQAVKDAQIRTQERLEREEAEEKERLAREEAEQKRKEQEKNQSASERSGKTECDHDWKLVYSDSDTSYECNGKTFYNRYQAEDEGFLSGKSVTTTTTYNYTYMCSKCLATREEHSKK